MDDNNNEKGLKGPTVKSADEIKKDEDNKKEDEEKEKSEEEERKKLEIVSFFSLFRYANAMDGILIFIATLASMGNGIAQPLSFLLFGQLIQEFISFEQNTVASIVDSMKTFALYYVAIAAGMFLCSFFQAAFWSISAVRQVHRLRIHFFKSILRQDIGWFDLHESGGLTTRLTDDLIKIQSGIGDKIGMTLQAITMFFGGFGIGFGYSWELTLVILSITPALMVTAAITGKVMAMFSSKEQTAYASAGAVAEEVISSIRTVAAFNGEEDAIDRYDSKLKAAEAAGVKKAMTIGGSMGSFHVVIFACYSLAFWYGSKMVADGKINGGELMIVFFCVMIGAAQLGQVAPNFEAINVARGAAYHVFNICAREPVINCISTKGKTIKEVDGKIEFKDVYFNYPSRPELKVLDGFNLDITTGSTIALVGESGCGKSTIVKLTQRFYDVDQGVVTLDGIDIRELNVRSMRSNIGVVSQEPVLFDMTIAENIRFGAEFGASQTEIEDAAKNANAHDFITELPKGYNTNVGEGGAQLSGGQKQRIAIARALIRNPRILLFDEATSALDTESESIVQAALDKASKGRTTIIIAHRLSTVRNADAIVAVQNGRVAEMGTHKELMAKKGVYHQLVFMQSMTADVEEIDEDIVESLTEEQREKVDMLQSLSHTLISSEVDAKLAKKFSRQLSKQLSITKKSSKNIAKQVKEEIKEEEEDDEAPVPPAPWSRIMGLNKTEWPYFVFGGISAAIVGILPVGFAVFISELITIFAKTPAEIKEESQMWALIFLGLGFLNGFAMFFASFLFGKAGEILTRRIRKLAFKAILRQDQSFFDEKDNSTGHLTARLATDASNVNGATSSRLNIMTQVTVMGVLTLAIAFYYSWKLTLLILAFVPLLAIGGAAHMTIFANFAAEESKRLVSASALATQAIMNVRTVATLGKENYFIEQYATYIEKPYRQSLTKSVVFGLTFGISSSIMMLANAAAFSLGGKMVQDGEIEFGDMFKVVLATVFGALIAGEISSMAPDFMEAKISAARIFKLIDRVPLIDSYNTKGVKLPEVEGSINFNAVEFNYPSRPDVKVLKKLSLQIKPGQKVALVGASGCGKSTSVGLLERFYDPQEGFVDIDNTDIKTMNLKWLRSQIGLVSQEPVLFARSIKENIKYGMSTPVTDEQVEVVAKKSNIHSFVMSLPKGYDTLVGEKGTLISGGQKQRIAIARALIRDPKIMLLDEATSALDSESEKIVQKALDVAMEGRTSVIIAHRLSTVQNADLVIVLQDGLIIEQGTHHELINKQGAYYMLNQAQF